MKKLMLFLSAVLALSLIAGCAFTGPVNRPTGTPDSTTPTTLPSDPTTVPTDPTTVPTDPTTVPTDPPEPTEDPKIAEMRSLLSSGWFNQALTSVYGTSEYVDLYEFFYNGFPEESREPTAEEWAQLKNIPGFREDLDLIRLPVSKMNKILFEYFNFNLNGTKGIGLDRFTYLESTDCYYFMRPAEDTNTVTDFTITHIDDDYLNVLIVYYTRDSSDEEFRIYVNQKQNHTIVANQIVKDTETITLLASFPKPYNYQKLFEYTAHNTPTKGLGQFILDLFLKDPSAFVKQVALAEKQSPQAAYCVSVALRKVYGSEELNQFTAACKRIEKDPAFTPDEQFAAFMMTAEMGHYQEAERAYRLHALEKRTPVDNYTVDTCLVKININGGYAPQFGTNAWIYDSYEQFQKTLADHKAREFFYTTVTNSLCPESYDQLVPAYDADFFEKNVLIRAEVRGSKYALPMITKVTAGEQSHWTSPLSLYFEYDENNREEFMVYILFIAIPKEHYRPNLEENIHHVDIIINGEPRLAC